MRNICLSNRCFRICFTKIHQARRCSSTWKQPVGFETPVKIYNCVAKAQVPLIVGNKRLVSWYTCGPTVYDHAHIGHASCYMRLDIVQRILKYHFGLNIVSSMNITDIDDKIIAQSTREKVSVHEISREYEKSFWEDMNALKIPRADSILRVTEHMPGIIDFISKLLHENLAYKAADGSVYFNVKRYEAEHKECKYGKLQNMPRNTETTNESKIKKNIEDFALWKAAKTGEPHWNAHFGAGRPGWHIECSFLASLIYGKTIDVHAGGIDLKFPHHENEEAQSCAYHGCSQWVNYWLHVGHLHLPNAAKMSKSLKNTISIQTMLQTCNPTTFRMICLLTNYKNHMEFSPECVKLAEAHVKSIKSFISNAKTLILKDATGLMFNSDVIVAELTKTSELVQLALSNDFDTPSVIKAVDSLISACNKVMHNSVHSTNLTACSPTAVASLLAVVNYVQDVCQMFGLCFEEETNASHDNRAFHEVMDVLVSFRHQLRTLSLARKDREALELCDNVREECKSLGIALKDSAKISTWNKC